MNPLLLSAQLIGPVRRIREEYPFDLLDAHFGYPDGIAAALLSRLLRVPFAVTLRGNETMHARHAVRRMLLRGALRRAALVIAVSEPLRRFAANLGVRDSRIKVVPNGIDPFLFRLRDRNECRRRHGIAPDARVILSAGSLIERKGHHRVIAALGAMVEEGVAAELLIAGGPGREGTFEGRLRRLAGESARVRLAGEVTPDTLAELMNAADVLCLASSREGWPNVVNEALACGTPVVATAVGGVPEMIPSPGFGFVIAPNDQEALVAALRSALETRWDRAAIAAWGQSRSWDQVAREAVDQMRQAVAPQRN